MNLDNLKTPHIKFKIQYFLSISLFILIVVVVHTVTAIVYGNEWGEALIGSFVAFGIINLLLADKIFKPVEEFLKTGKDKNAIKSAVRKLSYRTISAFLMSSSVYILLRLFFIFSGQDLSGADKFRLFFVFANRYMILAALVTWLILSYFILTLRKYLYDNHQIVLPAKKERLFVKLTAIFIVLLVSPAIDIYFVLYYSGQWKEFIGFITSSDTSLISTLIILLFAVILAWTVFSRGIYKAFKELDSAFVRVRKGDFGYQAVVLTNDEFGTLAQDFNSMSKGLEEREFIRDTFGRYISPEIASEVMKRKTGLSGEVRKVTVMFTDIADFTSISENMEPTELVKMLNEYFSFLVSVIKKHNGVVNKFIGDSVMAVFNAPAADALHADNALKAAIEIAGEGKNILFNELFIKTRIGINTGDVLAGNIGAENRLEYTVIGDGVNMASRLEGLNKNYGSSIMIGQGTKELLKEEYSLEEINNVAIKGKKEPQTVYKLLT